MKKNLYALVCLFFLQGICENVVAQTLVITTVAGNGTGAYSGDGSPATAASLNSPGGVFVDGSGNMYIGDGYNNVIRKVSPSGIITTIAGTGTPGFFGDGGPATAAELLLPTKLLMDRSGNLIFADYNNNRVRKISTTGIITTIAGNGTPGYTSDGVAATASALYHPSGMAIDTAGNIFIADYSNYRVRKVSPAGIITTVVGNGTPGSTGDGGPASAALIFQTFGLAIDNLGNMYLADAGNHKIRKVSVATGIISTIAGTGTPGYTADGIAATASGLDNPPGVTVDNSGNVYIADQFDNRIRMVSTSGIISTLAGNGTAAYRGDNGPATNAELNDNNEVFFDNSTGVLYLTDNLNNRVRTIFPDYLPKFTNGQRQTITVCENSDDTLNAYLPIQDSDVGQTETWTLLSVPPHGTINAGFGTVATGGVLYTTTSTGGVVTLPIPTVEVFYQPTTGYSGLDSFSVVISDGIASDTTKIVVTVNPIPSAITGALSVCTGSTITLADAVTGGIWSSGSTSVATVGSTGIVTGVAAGSAIISYTTSCGSTWATGPVSGPSALTPGSPSLCAGGTVILYESVSGGTWGSSNTAVASISYTGSSGAIITGVSAGTAVIFYEIGACIVYDTVTVTSGVGVISSPGAECEGSTVTLTDTTSGGTWSNTTTTVATISSGTGAVTGVSSGTSVITYTAAGGCYATAVLTVEASSPITPATSSVCVGGSETLTEPAPAPPYTGVWSSSNSALATVTFTSGVVTGISPGTDTISYQIFDGATAAGCAASATVNITSGAGSITPSTAVSICSGSTTTLADATSGGSWSSDNTAAATVSASGVVSGVAAGTATITYSIGSCNTTKVVTVTAGPAALSPSSATICAGTTVSLTETSSGGTWGSSATGIATVTSGGIVSGVASGTATIAYTTSSCSATAVVTVANTPAAIGPSTAVVLCAASTTTLTESVTGGAWSSNATGTATVSSTGVIKGVATGTATISYISGSCYVTKTVTVSAGPAAISPSSATVCTGTTVSLTETITGGTWSSSATGTATVSSTGIVGGIAAGTTTIAYSLSTCSASVIVTVANSPTAITPSTAIVFCSASTTTLAESVTGGTWSSGATGTATVSSAGVVTGVAAGAATISYASGSCYVTKTVTVSPGPEALLPASPTVCTGSTLSITDAVSGGTWSSTATATATVGSTGVASGVAPGSANIMYSIGSCVATDAITVILTPTVDAVSGTTSLCVGATTALTEVATDGVWSSSNTAAATVSATGTVYGSGIGTTTISYTITSSCGVIGAALVMTVNTSPSAGSITGSASMCAGTTLQLSNTVTDGSWSSSNSSASVNSASGLVTGITPGTDTITYTITTPCGTASTTKVITIGPYLSAGTIAGTAILCGGSTVHLTDVVTGGTWSSSNSSATVGSTGIVTGAVTGGMDTIYYTVTASCGSAVATDVIDVYPTAIAGTMSGVSALCIGSSVTFTETATGGVWSSYNSNATVTGGGLVTAVSAGTDIISYTVSNSCGTSVATVNVTISSATPTAGTITGSGSVCAGTPVALTDAVSGGVWSSSNTNASVSSAGMVIALASGLDTISYTLSTSCGTAIATFVISANGTVPTAGAITGASGICVGYPIAFTSTVSGGTWSISNSHATISSAGLVSGVTTGADTVTYTVSTSCGTAATTVAVTIGTTTAGAGSISGASTVCTGSSLILTDGTAGGAWSSSNTNASVIGGTVTGVTAGAAIISYSITYSCGIAYATNSITITPSSPISAITGPVTVCVGSTINLTDATPGGSWSSSNTNVTVSGGEVMGVALGTSTVSYTVISSCGTGSAVSVITIVAGSTLTLAPISGISIVCVGSGITLTDASPGGIWLASNAHATVVGPGIIDGISPGIDTIGYLVTGVCGNVEVTKILSVDTLPTVAPIAGPSSQCVGSTIALSDPTAGGIWTASIPAVGTPDLSTGVVTGLSAGTTIISYTVTNLYGCPNTVTLTDAVTPSSITTAITGSASVCLGSATTLSNATLGGTWSSSNTAVAVIDLATGSVTGLAPGTTTISYTVAGSCGIATITSVETVNTFPVVSAISGSPTVCAGAATVLGDAGAGGVWSSRNTAIAVVNPTNGTVTGVSGGTDEIYYLIANSCGSAMDSTSITVYPGPAVDAITAAYTAVCTGNTLDISDATAGGVWVSSNTAIATVSSAGAILGRAAGEDTIYYVVTNSRGCSSAAMVSITIGGAIVSATVDPAGAVELCQSHTVYMDVASSGGFTYQWLRNGIAITGATLSGYTTSATGNYSVILSNGICSETVTGPSVITPALPVISFTPPDKLSTGAYASYQWFLNGVLIAGATESTTDETGGGIYTVVVTDAQGCSDTSSGYTLGAAGVNNISAPQDIKVYPNPATSVVHIESPVQVNVSVLSIDGKLLIQQNNATDVDVSALADGMYMILVYDQSGLLLKTAKLAKLE